MVAASLTESVGTASKVLFPLPAIVVVAASAPTAALLHDTGVDDSIIAGLVFGASFAVFALLLPAAGLLREFGDRQMEAAESSLRSAHNRPDASAALEILRARHANLSTLHESLGSLRLSVTLAILAALVSCASLVAPTSMLLDDAPWLLTFSLSELLTAIALVSLAGAVVTSFPFTYHLLAKGLERNLGSALGVFQLSIDELTHSVATSVDKSGGTSDPQERQGG